MKANIFRNNFVDYLFMCIFECVSVCDMWPFSLFQAHCKLIAVTGDQVELILHWCAMKFWLFIFFFYDYKYNHSRMWFYKKIII